MTNSDPRSTDGPGQRRVDAWTLWSGGMATGLVAALVALVGVLILRGVLDIHVLAPEGEGIWGDASTAQLMLVAAVAALAATALAHILLVTTPSAMTFFRWIVGLVTVAAAVAPFTTDASSTTQVATAVIYLAIGIAIGSMISGVARVAVARGALSR